jgi:Protein of unknown function (DUF736)
MESIPRECGDALSGEQFLAISSRFAPGRRRAVGVGHLSVKLDAPSFPAPICATLTEADESGVFRVIWSRRDDDWPGATRTEWCATAPTLGN